MQSLNHQDYYHRDHHQMILMHWGDDLLIKQQRESFFWTELHHAKTIPPFLSVVRLDPLGDSANIKIRWQLGVLKRIKVSCFKSNALLYYIYLTVGVVRSWRLLWEFSIFSLLGVLWLRFFCSLWDGIVDLLPYDDGECVLFCCDISKRSAGCGCLCAVRDRGVISWFFSRSKLAGIELAWCCWWWCPSNVRELMGCTRVGKSRIGLFLDFRSYKIKYVAVM